MAIVFSRVPRSVRSAAFAFVMNVVRAMEQIRSVQNVGDDRDKPRLEINRVGHVAHVVANDWMDIVGQKI